MWLTYSACLLGERLEFERSHRLCSNDILTSRVAIVNYSIVELKNC